MRARAARSRESSPELTFSQDMKSPHVQLTMACRPSKPPPRGTRHGVNVCVNLKQDHTDHSTAALMQARPRGGACVNVNLCLCDF